MIKVIKMGKPKREKKYYQVQCTHCESMLAAELDDIWMDDPYYDLGRISCPVCRTKFNFIIKDRYTIDSNPFFSTYSAKEIDEVVYNSAHADTSKSGLEVLMDEKKLDDVMNSIFNKGGAK